MTKNDLNNLDCVAIDVLGGMINSQCMDGHRKEEVCEEAYEWAETFMSGFRK